MNPESLRIALRGVGANKLRSALTVLGILIGVSSVIVLTAVGTGSSADVQARIRNLGTNTLTVFNRPVRGQVGAQSQSITLTAGDLTALNDALQAPDVVAVSPVVNVNGATATYGGASTTVGQMVGTDAAYLTSTNRSIAAGRGLTADDVAGHDRVAVIGQTTAANLFGAGTDVIGQSIQINGVAYDIVGIQATKGSNGNQDLDDIVVAPYTAVQDTL
jgi:putative ABC transport system permease protein